jgi:acetylornithine deacetylase
VNAISVAADLIAHLNAYTRKLEATTDRHNGFEPHWSTVSVGTIQGGTATNIVAKECRFRWDWRPIPGDPLEGARESLDAYAARILPGLRRIAPETDIVTVLDSADMPLVAEEGSSAETLVMALAETNQTFKVPYGTEGPYFQRAAMPVVVFGPGSIEQAHKPDEYVDVAQIEECAAFLRKLIARFSGGARP